MLTQVARRAAHDRVPLMASGLAYQSALGLVPLAAVGFALLKALGALDARSAMLEFIANQMFPSASAEAIETIAKFADKIDVKALGFGGLVVTLFVVYSMFNTIEAAWNHIWSSPKRRTLWAKVVVFYTLTTLGTFLIAISLYYTASLWRGSRTLAFAMASGATATLFLFANKLLPQVRVRWKPALIGAGASAVMFEAAKFGFGSYVTNVALAKYDRVYGALALVPLFFFWIYVTWLIVLIGAELAHAVQRLAVLERIDRRRAQQGAWDQASGPLAVRLLVEVARRFASGAQMMSSVTLCETYELPEDTVTSIMGRLLAAKLVLLVDGESIGYTLGRPAEQIGVDEVLALFRPAESERRDDKLQRLWDEVERATRDKTGGVNVADLIG